MHKTKLSVIISALALAGCTSVYRNSQSDVMDLDPSVPIPTVEPIVQDVAPIENNIINQQPLEEDVMANPVIIAAKKATIKTSKGDIVVELYPEEAPRTVANFSKKGSTGYYENLIFHRVEDWVVQGGDPDGNGTGGGKMSTELNEVSFVTGSLGVARGGDIKVSNDSQFFICTKDCDWLDGQYTNFGKVTEGMDIVNSIAIGDKILGIEINE